MSRHKRARKKRDKGRSIIDFPEDYIVIDLETTGLDPERDEIIEAAGIKYHRGKETARFSELIKPEQGISAFITELTGISEAMVKTARSEAEVLKDFRDFLGDSILVGHNVNFDINFLYDAFLKYFAFPFKNDFIDTRRLSKTCLEKELKRHRLCDLTAYYGLSNEGAHRAMADVENTAAVFRCLHREAAEKFDSLEAFKAQFRRSGRYYGSAVRAKDIKAESAHFDADSFFFKKHCVITGSLQRMSRKDAMQSIANIGGFNQDNVTKQTNILIVGDFADNPSLKGRKSAKLRKAERYKAE